MTTTLSPGSSKVKFRLAGGPQPLILLPVQVNGRGPFEFILDTGAGTSLLTPAVAQQLNLELAGSKQGQTAGGPVSVSLAHVESLRVGEMEVENVDVGIVDLAPIARAVGANIDGDLGYNFLKDFRVTIDYRDCELVLADPKRIETLGRATRTEVPIRLANAAKPLILVDVHVNSRGPFQFAIDTGTSTTALDTQLAENLGLTTAPVTPITTGGAPLEVSAATLPSFQLGGAKIDNMPVIVGGLLEMLSSVVGTKLDGIIGYNFLRNYKVVIDYPGETLALI